jgi:DNA-binding beta-propeller fold protein YncE
MSIETTHLFRRSQCSTVPIPAAQCWPKLSGGIMTRLSSLFLTVLLSSAVVGTPAASAPAIMLVGIDTKFWIDDAGGRVFRPDSGDVVQVYELIDPAHPNLIGALPLPNSVVGPPTNLGVTPDGKLALIASSIIVGEDEAHKAKPDNRLFVVDITARPPKLISTVQVGEQPSGLAISPDGAMALVTNRAGKSVTVLSIKGATVTVTDTVAMDEIVTSAAFTPDGKRALISEYAAHRVTLLDIDRGVVKRTKVASTVGLWPYTVAVTPDGRLGLAGATGNQATSDGNIDPIAVIDLAAKPPRTVNFIATGDGIEGLVVSPRGDYAAATILQGSLDAPKGAWFAHSVGSVALLRIAEGAVTLAARTDVGAFPEGVAFSPDGNWVYVGNFASRTISVLHLENGKLVDTHADIALPGPPAALRVGSQ